MAPSASTHVHVCVELEAALGSIYKERKRTQKRNFSLISVAARCEQQHGFPKNHPEPMSFLRSLSLHVNVA